MTIEVKVPALPESVTDGTLVTWHKQPGDAIERDEPLVDIETDKVVLEVPSPGDGVLEKILVTSGDTVVADQLIGLISSTRTAGTARADGQVAGDQQAPAEQLGTGVALGPAVRKLVAEYHIDPAQVPGTGKNGRITKADVLAYIGTPRPAPAVAHEESRFA